jgi:hypothetical protein
MVAALKGSFFSQGFVFPAIAIATTVIGINSAIVMINPDFFAGIFSPFSVFKHPGNNLLLHNLVPYSSFSCSFYKKMSCKALIPFIGFRNYPA